MPFAGGAFGTALASVAPTTSRAVVRIVVGTECRHTVLCGTALGAAASSKEAPQEGTRGQPCACADREIVWLCAALSVTAESAVGVGLGVQCVHSALIQ